MRLVADGVAILAAALWIGAASAQEDDFTTRQEALLDQVQAELAAEPDNAEAAIWAGRRLGYLGRYEEAIATYTQGWRRHPADARFPRHIGHRLISMRRYDEAEEMFEQAVALAAAQPDAVEPDGLPNAAGVPTSTLKGNIYYHLGLARYLQGDFAAAARAYEGASALAHNPDAAAAARYWLFLSLFRAGDRAAAQLALAGVDADWALIENGVYHELSLCFRGDADCDEIMTRARAAEGIDFATPAYGIAMAHYTKGETTEARAILDEIVGRGSSAAFGHLAAEADLANAFHEKK